MWRALGVLPDGARPCDRPSPTIFTRRGARQGQLYQVAQSKKGCPKQPAAMGTADPPAAVVQRLQEEHLRKDVIGYGSLGEALAAQGGRAEEASKAFDDALACCPAGVPPHLQRAYAHYCGCLLYTSPSPRDKRQSRMPSSA